MQRETLSPVPEALRVQLDNSALGTLAHNGIDPAADGQSAIVPGWQSSDQEIPIMASQAPRVTIARPNRGNGILPILASATQKKPALASESQTSRISNARLKIVIRRLAPGLTQADFDEALGNEWKVGEGKVDWAVYKPGKISKDAAKPSRPSRAYLHLTKQEHTTGLSEKVRNTTFNDTKGSSKDPALLGPPSVEFAPFGRTPSSRPRKDARQSTIDQDPEFIDFLESLTNPVAKAAPVDQESEANIKSKDKITVTPLVQYLKDKKANKGKESSAGSKSSKHSRHDSKDAKTAVAADSKATAANLTPASPKKRSAQAVKVEQAAREAVKVLNKQAANTNKAAPASTKTPTNVTNTTPAVTSNSPAANALAEKKRERGNASAAAKMLQRDLGIGGGRGGRRGQPTRNIASNAPPAAKQASGATQTAATTHPAPATDTSSATTTTAANSDVMAAEATNQPPQPPPTGPAASRAPKAPTSAIPSSVPTISKSAQTPSTSTQAFLKHANPSQGVTEPLLEEAFKEFGTVKKVEIDKKKGFAYVDFAESESLQKAIKASPIKVAQGQVVVLERKTGPTLQARNSRGGPMMGPRGGGMSIGGRRGPGGSMKGRGGFSRGGINANNKPTSGSTNTPTTKPSPAAAVASSSATGSNT